MDNYNELITKLNNLSLDGFTMVLDSIITKVNDKDIDFYEALNLMVDNQIKVKKEKVYAAGIKVSHFPFIKTIDDFDFSFQPSLSKALIKDFCSLRFMENNENIIFIGTPGTGKTHLATAIGLEATRNSKLTYFITCKELTNQLKRARSENTLDRRLKHFYSYSLLIIDELGHDILDEESASDLFQLIQMRYEHHPTIITTNYNISQWHTIFKNNKTALDAMLDRLLHHSNIVTINGPSYRLKDVSEYLIE